MAIDPPRSLTARMVSAAGLWCLLVLGAAGLLLSSLFKEAMERNFDARLGADLENLVAAIEAAPNQQVIQTRPLGDPRYERAYSGWYWQIRGRSGILLRSRSLWDGELTDATGAAPSQPPPTPGEFGESVAALGPNGENIRIFTRRLQLPGDAPPYAFSVAGATSEMRAASRRFNRALVLSLGALGLGLLVALVVQVRYGLSPLREAQRALTAIRTGSREKLEGAFPSEIQPLAQELNALLEQNGRVVDRARTHVGNLAHGLKTPLSVLRNAAHELADADRTGIERQLGYMQDQIDRYLARARAAGPIGLRRGRTPVLAVVDELERTLRKIYRDRPLAMSIAGDRDLAFAGDAQDLQEILGNLLDNAFKWGRRKIQVTVRVTGPSGLTIEVSDDGPGLAPEGRATVLQRGRRLDESTPGSGLGLDIARDIAELYGGEIELSEGPEGGLMVTAHLPAAERLVGANSTGREIGTEEKDR